MNYFKQSEECCPCCGSGGFLPDFRDKLNKARKIADIPFIINSGFRCPSHNADVGGSQTSSHMIGCAADIKCTDGWSRYKILDALIRVGFNRIGIGKTFIHVDNDTQKPAGIVWLY